MMNKEKKQLSFDFSNSPEELKMSGSTSSVENDSKDKRKCETSTTNAEIKSRIKVNSKYRWDHFSFICDKVLIAKVKAITAKENITIRELMEYTIKQMLYKYEKKHGTLHIDIDIPPKKNVKDIM